uniref:Uncharacterized protein n=1 Tax=Clytia hemisphaerica TaxID=252671 RepID=A0A7M5XEZ3_9CNID
QKLCYDYNFRLKLIKMPKISKIAVFGAKSVGKTSIIQQIVYGNYSINKMMYPTIADSYDAWVDADRGQKERIRIYDLQGQDPDPNFISPSHHIQIADAFILVFSVTSKTSFSVVEKLRKEIVICRGKDVPIVVLGTKVDMSETRECQHNEVMKWADHEKGVFVSRTSRLVLTKLCPPLSKLKKKM